MNDDEGSSSQRPEFAMKLMAERRWPEAARAFRNLLKRSDDPAIWMQYGHALKEAGYFGEAGVAYARAKERFGLTLDVLIQFGHWNKLIGQFNKAIEQYTSANLHPDAGPEVKQELQVLLNPLRRATLDIGREASDEMQFFFSCVSPPLSAGYPSKQLGRAHYSYSFAMRGFQGAADDLGLNYVYLEAPHYIPDARKLTWLDRPIHLAFYPWSRARLLKGAHNILAFAWEFESLPNEPNWHHAFSKHNVMLDLFDQIWVPSKYAVQIVQRYTKRTVSLVPSPIVPTSVRRNFNEAHRHFRRSSNAAQQTLRHIEWVPLSVFPRMQANFDNHAFARRKRTQEILCNLINGKAPRVYLLVFNPCDLRKQCRPLIEGFINFNRLCSEAVLLIKTISPDDTSHSINRRILSLSARAFGLQIQH